MLEPSVEAGIAATRPAGRVRGLWALGCPLPELTMPDRCLARGVGLVASNLARAVSGLEHVGGGRDPFVLALNHGTRREAILVPSLLILHRGGRPVHFLADWNFRLIPGVGLLYDRAGVITVARKPARPRFLDALRPRFAPSTPPLEHARRLLVSGRSVGIFPEGTVNRDSSRLLGGRHGAARLSLETGAPVVPAGLRYRPPAGAGPGVVELHIGDPLAPPRRVDHAAYQDVKVWHREIMTSIARLSGKTWTEPRRNP